MTRNIRQKSTYRVLDGKLCIEHYILLQQLTFRKKGKTGEYKDYYSYFIKLPLPVYDLLAPEDDIIYLKKEDDKIILQKNMCADGRRVKIQVDNKSLNKKREFNRYKISIPKKFITENCYERGKSYMTCRITGSDNSTGYTITLEQR